MGFCNFCGVNAPIGQFAGHGNTFAVFHHITLYAADSGCADENTGAVCISQAVLNQNIVPVINRIS